jgi:cellulose synthase/poly-beta-1,6-N-acetylglucosamine synthase-like glycosyltransferase
MTASNQSQTAFSTDSQQPLVSVIIPAYNRPAYLKEAIESAVGQSYQNIEIIVSDDCSPEYKWGEDDELQQSV